MFCLSQLVVCTYSKLIYPFNSSKNSLEIHSVRLKSTKTLGPPMPHFILPRAICWASLVALWWRIHLPKQERQIQSLGQEDPLRRKRQPIPVFLPGESHGQKSLAGYSPWGDKGVGQNLATKNYKQSVSFLQGQNILSDSLKLLNNFLRLQNVNSSKALTSERNFFQLLLPFIPDAVYAKDSWTNYL